MGGEKRKPRRIRHEAGSNSTEEFKNVSQPQSSQEKPPSAHGRHETNVAVAENQIYEPVKIMESKSSEEPAVTKYRRRQVISNWTRYEIEENEDEPEQGEDYLLGEDFSKVLQLQSQHKGGYLHLKGEVSWGKSDQNILQAHGLGALKISDLAAAVATIPLHIQLNIPEERLPKKFVSHAIKTAENQAKNYRPSQKSGLDINEKILKLLKIDDAKYLQSDFVEKENEREKQVRDPSVACVEIAHMFTGEPSVTDACDDEGIDEEQPSEVSSWKQMTSEEGPIAREFQACSGAISEPSAPVVDPKKLDFGLPKLEGESCKESQEPCRTEPLTTFPDVDPTKSSFVLSDNESPEEESSPNVVDLNAPIVLGKKPIIVSSAETEELEDWLDSVLGD